MKRRPAAKRRTIAATLLALLVCDGFVVPVAAQDDDKPNLKLLPPPAGPRDLIRERIQNKNAGNKPATTTRPRRSRPTTGTATPSVKPGTGDDSPDTTMRQDPDGPDLGNIKPFETGVEYKPTSPRSRVTFNLEDADLTDLVRLISSITGRRFILSGKSRSLKATVYAPTKVTAAEAYRAFLAILEMNGLTVVPSGRYLKIVEATGVEKEPIGTYVKEGARLPRDERFITRLHRLESVSAEDVTNILGKFSSKHGQITAYAPTNTLIITDTGANIRRMMRIVQEIDVSRTGTQMWIEPIHYANAVEIADRLNELFPATAGASSGGTKSPAKKAAGGGSNTSTVGKAGAARLTKILPDERTNSIIIIATERAYLRILEMIRQLDVPLEGSGGIHVHYLQHGDAEEISQTLSSLVSGSSGAGGGARRGNRGGAANNNAAAAAGGSTAVFEGDIKVTAHKPSNALVITSSLHDYAALKRVIDRLDAPRRQVFIEAVVMELEVNRSKTLGVDFHTGIPDPVGEGSLGVIGSQRIGGLAGTAGLLSPDGISGLAVGVQGPILDELTEVIGISVPSFGATLTALSTASDANILSTPHIIAMDNEEAEINIGQNVPLQTNAAGFGALGNLGALAGAAGQNASQLTQAAGLLGGGFGGGFNAPRQDVGTKLTITPHINESDQIRLEINEEISEAGSSPQGTLGAISLNRRTAKTQAVVADQETLVIGGLMRERVATSEDKVPILGDIPLLGALFRRTTETKQKTNLLLFLTPYIVRDSTDLRRIYERKIRERQEFLDRYLVFGNTDYEPPMDYSRTRGLVAEIIREMDSVSAEELLAAEAAARPPLEHIPRPPVGSAVEFDTSEGEEDGDVVITPDGAISPSVLTPIDREPLDIEDAPETDDAGDDE